MTIHHPSANNWATDKDPLATERAVLECLAALPPFHSLTGRVIGYRVYGTEQVGRQRVASAIGRLKNKRLIEGSVRYRITDAGRAALELSDTFSPDGVA